MRKALLAAAIAGLVIVLYAAAGYWVAPRFVREALAEQANRLGLELRLGEVRTDPFAFSVALEGIELVDAGGRMLAAARSASADLAWASLWRAGWTVQQLAVHQLSVALVVGPKGTLNWPAAKEQAQGPQHQTPVVVQQLRVSEGAVHLVDRSRGAPVEAKLEALGLEVSGLSTHAGEPAPYRVAARLADGANLASRGTVSLQPLGAQGELSIAAVAVSKLWKLAAPGTEPGQGRVQASASYAFDGERLVLQDVSVKATDFAYAGIELPHIVLEAPKIALPSREPFEVSGNATVAPGSSASAQGTVALQPFAVDLQVGLKEIGLPQAQSWLPPDLAVNIASGALSANGRLRIDHRVTYEGAATVRDARFEEAGSGELLLAWQRLETEKLNLRFGPFGLEIGELAAQAPSGRLIIEEDGRINFAALFKGGKKTQGKHSPSEVAVKRLRIDNGTLDFTDRSLDNDFAVTIRELSGAVTGFSTLPGNPARVQLTGRVEQYGSARIRGTVNLDEPKSLTNIFATFRNVDLAALTPYIVKFAGYRVESGRLSAELRYRVREGRLVGQNQLSFEQLRLGEKVQDAGARDLPLELAVALLADSQGRISLDVPVSGNLNDPQFNFGGLIARALGNVIGKIVSAPFRALAAVFGKGGMDLDTVRFEPGAVALTPPAEQSVAQVAKALEQRPQLGVVVQGGYDPQADVAALRRDTVRRAIAQRAGYRGKGPLDFSDPKVLHAAENLYMQRIASRLEMLELRKTEPRYARALLERLAAAEPVAPGTAETLARARAETVRAALLQQGVDPSRVRLEAPAAEEAGKEGVPTLLSLNAERAASTGATGR
jgi:hypothetical protein